MYRLSCLAFTIYLVIPIGLFSLCILDTPCAVNAIYGSIDGLRATAFSAGIGRDNQVWTQNSPDIEDDAEKDDHFGWTLATGYFNNDTISDLAIGEEMEDVGTSADAGAINVIYGSAVGITIITGGLSATVPPSGIGRDDQMWAQNSAGIEDDAEPNDRFGFSLA